MRPAFSLSPPRGERAQGEGGAEPSDSSVPSHIAPARLSPSVARIACLLALLSLALACGKKGDPQPPLPQGPNAVKDLAVEQEGEDAVLTFTFPDRLLTGAPLVDLDAIEVYRVVRPSSELTEPRRAGGPPPTSSGATSSSGVIQLPGASERREATNVRLAEEAFYQAAERVAALHGPEMADATQGASLVYRDPLSFLFVQEDGPHPLAYAVVSVRRDGQRSPLSNIVTLAPDIAPDAPELEPPILEEGRVCLEWKPPRANVLSQPVDVGGYRVYRRPLADDAYDAPLNAAPVAGNSFVDTSAPYGVPLAYTVRAVLAKNPKIEGLPAEEIYVKPQDVYPPKAPARVDVLSEGALVRVLWDPVDSPDLAGYVVFRAEGTSPPIRMNDAPLTDPFFSDTTAKARHRYRYSVRSVDRAGNLSAPSVEAVAEPF
jgi:hypothetical protein